MKTLLLTRGEVFVNKRILDTFSVGFCSCTFRVGWKEIVHFPRRGVTQKANILPGDSVAMMLFSRSFPTYFRCSAAQNKVVMEVATGDMTTTGQ